MTTSSERSHGKRGAKASRWTRQEAVEEEEVPDLGEGQGQFWGDGKEGLWEVPEPEAGALPLMPP